MTARLTTALSALAAAACAAASFGVVLAPALAVRQAARHGGLPSTGKDLVAASALLGVGTALLVWHRLGHATRLPRGATARRAAWIAALNALAVLTLASTLLLLGVLALFTGVHADLAADGLPVVALWIGVQLVAIVVSRLVGRMMVRWILAGHRVVPAHRPADVPTGVAAARPREELVAA